MVTHRGLCTTRKSAELQKYPGNYSSYCSNRLQGKDENAATHVCYRCCTEQSP